MGSRAGRNTAVLCVLAIATSVSALESATGAQAHTISLVDARRIVEKRARAIAEIERAGFIEIRSGETRIDVVVSCKRRAKHLARCSWRASVFADYNGTAEELELAVVCSGGGWVRLVGKALRSRITSRTCLH